MTSSLGEICSKGEVAALQQWMTDHAATDWSVAVPWTDSDETECTSPPIFICVDYGHTALVKLLLEEGNVDPNGADDNGYTPAQWAAWKGQADILQLLIDHGATIDQDTLDMTQEVDDGKASEAVMQLIRAHMDPYAALAGDDDEILMKACREGDLSKVTQMLDEGYDYNKWKVVDDADGMTKYQFFSPMNIAIRRGQMEIVTLFNERLGLHVDNVVVEEEEVTATTAEAPVPTPTVPDTIPEEMVVTEES